MSLVPSLLARKNLVCFLVVSFSMLTIGACADMAQKPDPNPAPGSQDNFLSGLQKWGGGVAWNDSLYDIVADYDVFSYQAHNLFSDASSVSLIDELRQRNPGQLVGAYYQAHSLHEWQIRALQDGDDSYGADWARHCLDHLAQTTLGDTARCFNRAYLVDITRPGAIEGMVDVLVEWRGRSTNNRPGTFLMLDHCSVPVPSFLSGAWLQETKGETDLDGDGIAHEDDPDEQESLRQAYYRLADQLSAALPDVKLMPNGSLIRDDPAFRARVDGIYIEGGFRWGWGPDYFAEGLFSEGPMNLSTMLSEMRSDGYSIYEWKEDYRVGWAISMFYDNLVPLMSPGHNSAEFVIQEHPGEWDVGPALSEAEVIDGVLTRRFRDATATLELLDDGSPRPFRFQLTGAGESDRFRLDFIGGD